MATPSLTPITVTQTTVTQTVIPPLSLTAANIDTILAAITGTGLVSYSVSVTSGTLGALTFRKNTDGTFTMLTVVPPH